MNKQKKVFAVVSIAVALCAITAVIASPKISGTPLYTFRMEQVSSRMNFLPTVVNDIIYTAENGYILNYDVSGRYDVDFSKAVVAGTCSPTCPDTCPNTCGTCHLTCPDTCLALSNCLPCEESYGGTCSFTCGTCYITCPITCIP